MEVKYNLTRKDFWNFTKYAYTHVPTLRIPLILGVFIAFAIIASSLEFFYSKGIGHLTTYIAIAVTILILYYYMIKLLVMWLPSAKPGILGEHILSISPEGIRERTFVNDSFIKWNEIKEITSNKKYIFIFIDLTMCYQIPKVSFSTEDEANIFLNTALMYWQSNSNSRAV